MASEYIYMRKVSLLLKGKAHKVAKVFTYGNEGIYV